MVDKIQTRSLWGRLTAPSRVKKVKRRKENASPEDFQDQLKKRKAKEKQGDQKSTPPPAVGLPRSADDGNCREDNADCRDRSRKKKTGGHVDIHI